MFEEQNNGISPKSPKKIKFNVYWVYGILAITIIAINVMNVSAPQKEVTWTEFRTLVEKEAVSEITVVANKNIANAKI